MPGNYPAAPQTRVSGQTIADIVLDLECDRLGAVLRHGDRNVRFSPDVRSFRMGPHRKPCCLSTRHCLLCEQRRIHPDGRVYPQARVVAGQIDIWSHLEPFRRHPGAHVRRGLDAPDLPVGTTLPWSVTETDPIDIFVWSMFPQGIVVATDRCVNRRAVHRRRNTLISDTSLGCWTV